MTTTTTSTHATTFVPDPVRLERIAREYKSLKSMPTAEVLRLHKNNGRRVQCNYTAGEMGGKQALIGDLLRRWHGEKHVAAFFGST